MELQKNSKQ